MLLINALIALAPLPLAFAQGSSSSSSTSPSPTSAAGGSVQTIAVGKDGISFTPDTLTAAPGTTVEFHFYPPIHSVAQSTFDSPCAPSGPSAFFSGGFNVPSGGEAPKVWTLTINDTSPLWYYCGYPGHCQGGMAGVINPSSNSSQSVAAYQAAAKKVSKTTAPASAQGGVISAPKSAATTGSTTSSATGSGTSSAPSATKSTSAGNDLKAMSAWMGIFGVTVVGVGIALIAA